MTGFATETDFMLLFVRLSGSYREFAIDLKNLHPLM